MAPRNSTILFLSGSIPVCRVLPIVAVAELLCSLRVNARYKRTIVRGIVCQPRRVMYDRGRWRAKHRHDELKLYIFPIRRRMKQTRKESRTRRCCRTIGLLSLESERKIHVLV